MVTAENTENICIFLVLCSADSLKGTLVHFLWSACRGRCIYLVFVKQEINLSHLDIIQVQQTFPTRLWQQRQSHKLRPKLFSWFIWVIRLIWCHFLFWLICCHPWQHLRRWLVVGRKRSEPHKPTQALIGPEGWELHCDWLLHEISNFNYLDSLYRNNKSNGLIVENVWVIKSSIFVYKYLTWDNLIG